MNDILKALRDNNWTGVSLRNKGLISAAIEEIEALTEELNALKHDIARYIQHASSLAEEVERLQATPPASAEPERQYIEAQIQSNDTGRQGCTAYIIPSAEGLDKLYYELINQVEQKIPGESRHQTALRLIQQATQPASGLGKAKTLKALQDISHWSDLGKLHTSVKRGDFDL